MINKEIFIISMLLCVPQSKSKLIHVHLMLMRHYVLSEHVLKDHLTIPILQIVQIFL